ncbi:hypothetical protein F5B20DRAFT_582478 [Whalleya microplaca]|nr:hypothetical protein F5B20DRAFT_582478 [Whalleya microplaca]
MKNGEHNISSHYTTQHKPHSAYQKKQSRKECGLVSQSFHQKESHHRTVHKIEGVVKALHAEVAASTNKEDATPFLRTANTTYRRTLLLSTSSLLHTRRSRVANCPNVGVVKALHTEWSAWVGIRPIESPETVLENRQKVLTIVREMWRAYDILRFWAELAEETGQARPLVEAIDRYEDLLLLRAGDPHNESHHCSKHQMKGMVKPLHNEAVPGDGENAEEEEEASDGSAEYIPHADRRPNNDKDDRGPSPGIGGAEAVNYRSRLLQPVHSAYEKIRRCLRVRTFQCSLFIPRWSCPEPPGIDKDQLSGRKRTGAPAPVTITATATTVAAVVSPRHDIFIVGIFLVTVLQEGGGTHQCRLRCFGSQPAYAQAMWTTLLEKRVVLALTNASEGTLSSLQALLMGEDAGCPRPSQRCGYQQSRFTRWSLFSRPEIPGIVRQKPSAAVMAFAAGWRKGQRSSWEKSEAGGPRSSRVMASAHEKDRTGKERGVERSGTIALTPALPAGSFQDQLHVPPARVLLCPWEAMGRPVHLMMAGRRGLCVAKLGTLRSSSRSL